MFSNLPLQAAPSKVQSPRYIPSRPHSSLVPVLSEWQLALRPQSRSHAARALKIRTPMIPRIATGVVGILGQPVPGTARLLGIPSFIGIVGVIVVAGVQNSIDAPLGILPRHVRGPAEAVAGVRDHAVELVARDALGPSGEVAVVALTEEVSQSTMSVVVVDRVSPAAMRAGVAPGAAALFQRSACHLGGAALRAWQKQEGGERK